MKRICPMCLHIGSAKRGSILGGTYIPLFGLIVGAGVMWFPTELFTKNLDLIVYLAAPVLALVCAATAIYLLIDYYKNSRNLCAKCNNSQMVKLDSLDGKNLISEYNLEV